MNRREVSVSVKDQGCIPFLQWSLPKLRMQWQCFRKVRGQVCKLVDRRMRELGLAGVSAYRLFLEVAGSPACILESI